MTTYLNEVFQNSDYGKGYSFPRPLISKLSVISSFQNKFRYISLTFDLFQNHPELFKETSTNLIYLLQTGTTFKKEAIISLFNALLNSTERISLEEANKILNTEIPSNNKKEFIEIQSLMLLYAYYIWINNDIKYFEPAMKPLHTALNTFLSTREVYYNGTKYNYDLFKPLCYNKNGDNLFNFIPYFCFILTFYSDGQPYRFFEEIGSETSYNNLLVSIDNYFSKFFKLFMKQIGLENNYTSNFNDYPVFISTIFENRDESGTKIVVDKLQQMLNDMLKFENIIELRNNEMNKSAQLLDDNYNDQNRLSDNFLKQCYDRNMDTIIENLIVNNPICNILNKYPVFQPISLKAPFVNYDLDELIWLTHYCLAGGDKKFYIDEDYNYRPIISNDNNNEVIIEEEGVKATWGIKTNINRFNYTMGTPFSDCDFSLQMLTSFIKQRIIAQQENFLDTPDLSSTWMANEEINVVETDFENEECQQKLFDLYINSSWVLIENEINLIFNTLMKTNKKFKEDIENLLKLHIICSKVYPNVVAGRSIGVLLISCLKELLIYHLDNQNKSELTLDNFNFYHYLMKFVININDEEIKFRINKIYNILVSIVFLSKDSYCRFVNTCTNDFSKYLQINSYIQIPYIKGNDDDCDYFAIGGSALYNKMIDPNSLNRGYYYLSQTIGINEDIYTIHEWTKNMEQTDISVLLNNSADNPSRFNEISNETFSILRETYINSNTNVPKILQNYKFTLNGDKLQVEFKNYNDWMNYKLNLNGVEYLITRLLILLGGKQVVGSYIDNQFKSKLITFNKQMMPIPNETVTNGFKFTDKLKILVSINNISDNKYLLPIYKYQSEVTEFNLSFANPPGYNLIQVTLDSTIKNKNNVAFLFTKTTLDNGYNFYAI